MKYSFRHWCFLICAVMISAALHAQDNIALGEWRMHISFNEIIDVAEGNNKVFAASSSGILVVDKADKSYSRIHKLNGLTRAGIKKVAYHSQTDQLLVVYDDGTFDAIKEKKTRNIDPSQNTVLTGPKQIHAVEILGSVAYLATDYGVLLFDLTQSSIKETWRDLGPNGNTLSIRDITFTPDSAFLATANGVIAGNLQDNLLDFARWKRYEDEAIETQIDFISYFGSSVIAVVKNVGLYQHSISGWTRLPTLENEKFNDVRRNTSSLVISQDNKIFEVNEAFDVSQVSNVSLTSINVAIKSGSAYWIGDATEGLSLLEGTSLTPLTPNGPAFNSSRDLAYYHGRIVSVAGGFSAEGVANQTPGRISIFEKGAWKTERTDVYDIASISFSGNGDLFAGSFGYGVLHLSNDAATLYDESNSSLINLNPPARNVNISSVTNSKDGLWVGNYGAASSLHFRGNNGDWSAYSFPILASRYPLQLLDDGLGKVWMRLDPERGGGLVVYDPKKQEHVYLTENDGAGELPSRYVYALGRDRDGFIWAGTDQGVAYFYDWKSDAVKPIFENRFLLRDDKVTAIAIDGGNRKWMGTERGVWLFDPSGEKLIANFNKDNSPLLSNRINDIEIDQTSGEVFFATDMGIVSFRSDATESSSRFSSIKIFPNPVLANFSGLVSINGLATDAIVKITDVSGKLVFETRANGGTASWNMRDHTGRRVSTGVFLIFAATPDGGESAVGKIAVVN